jgi:hypothetical protein
MAQSRHPDRVGECPLSGHAAAALPRSCSRRLMASPAPRKLVRIDGWTFSSCGTKPIALRPNPPRTWAFGRQL